ncbi:MAG: DoxX family membrane protein [Verrucomicrobia bacterium]|nr:DoxX family membrane protein [Verrucomicrobiota bacterium]
MSSSSASKTVPSEPAISQEAYASDLLLLRLSLGLVYFLFGFLKLFPDLSPAELLGSQTIMRMSGYQMGADLALRSLAVMEVLIGIGFILNICLRWVSILFFAHMAGTF